MDYVISYLARWEGSKRLESFISEYCFSYWAKAFYGADNISFNWYTYKPHKDEQPLFIRFTDSQSPTKINTIDRTFTSHLLKKNIIVVFAYYKPEQNAFFASTIREEGKQLAPVKVQDAASLFLSLSGIQCLIEPEEAHNKETGLAEVKGITKICSALGSEDTYRLYLNRRFINEVLRPSFDSHPSDLDAVCLHNGKLRIMEFKRKTPAAGYMEGFRSSARFDAKQETETHIGRNQERQVYQAEIKAHLEQLGIIKNHSHPVYGLDWGHSQSARWYLDNGFEYCLIHWHREKARSIDHIDPITWGFREPETIRFKLLTQLEFLGFNITYGRNSGMNGNVRIQDMLDAEIFDEVRDNAPFPEVFNKLNM